MAIRPSEAGDVGHALVCLTEVFALGKAYSVGVSVREEVGVQVVGLQGVTEAEETVRQRIYHLHV